MENLVTEILSSEESVNFDLVNSIPNKEHELKHDAKIKISKVLNLINDLKLSKFDFLDVGSGLSHIPAVVKNVIGTDGYVKAVDLVRCWPWNHAYNVETEICDYLEYEDDRKYDIISDCCAMHEIAPRESNDQSSHVGLERAYKKTYNLLKDGGYFVSSSDCFREKYNFQNGIIDYNDMIDLLEKVGFKVAPLTIDSPWGYNTGDGITYILNFVVRK